MKLFERRPRRTKADHTENQFDIEKMMEERAKEWFWKTICPPRSKMSSMTYSRREKQLLVRANLFALKNKIRMLIVFD